ncbi:putative succinyl-CoA synthetase functions in the citric acid cycle (TCA), coupling the hydrolysis of succinyl-CoA to the synthesis of ATP and thus represents the only step of substrate- level phosphorylation in the TCA [Lyophyllum shimeji]|uniref:Succinate--CoA ligase [ADP-forming] subunit beta, mitochondrial n=1 Tax=Lyophyllum shimeji TaxID=47721 RepID=A0A9P3UJ28_LYOSH|nr:putative succinyl-CoA synthetase functions in the citric acid cycle (TCA), coupling the hydrolysis of succinyl-CoA to the synthesis of ATP and thus represents the only step of substrate- level phosphorylation in the TCA [Lyophyllum shimeji]
MLASLRKVGSFARAASAGQRRFLSIHEYQSMDLLKSYGVPIPKSVAAKSPAEAFKAAKSFGHDRLVIKAQVLAGGRGKGTFDNGFQGGVHMVDSPEQAKDIASKMIGSKLITKQTGARGRVCNAVMLAERRQPAHEYYVAILNDRASQGVVLVASAQGGMNIEEVAAKDPDAIITTPISFANGLSKAEAIEIAKKLGFKDEKTQSEAADIFINLYRIFKEKDATQIEINPMALTTDGEVLCMDAKFGFDDNAEFRQLDIFALRDISQEEPSEVRAQKHALNFIKLDGSVGCLVNGAGLAMATMDVLALHGGEPANFLDVGGGATPETVKAAFEILLEDPKVKSIFINIFGGIMRCDYIAEGVITATKELQLDIPLIVRLKGTKEAEAKEMIRKSGLKIEAFDSLDDAAERASRLAD